MQIYKRNLIFSPGYYDDLIITASIIISCLGDRSLSLFDATQSVTLRNDNARLSANAEVRAESSGLGTSAFINVKCGKQNERMSGAHLPGKFRFKGH